jgi:3'(2'), 5'-bisphosphate nucleotidase
MSYELERRVAIDAVLMAARLCERVRKSMPQAIAKNDKSPVTIADYGSQALICRAITAAFPDDAIIAEEDAAALSDDNHLLAQATDSVREFIPEATPERVINWIGLGSSTNAKRFWTLDPIDGTKGFLRDDQYAVALALIENGQVQLGVLACPAYPTEAGHGALFTAIRGGGASMTPIGSEMSQGLKVVAGGDTDRLRFVESVESGHGDQSRQAAIAQAVGITAPSLRMDSQAKYAAVANGEAVLYLRLPSPKTPDYREKIWDHAAGVLVVEEAGGKVTDMFGQPLDFSQGAKLTQNQGTVVSNGVIHQTVIDALAALS